MKNPTSNPETRCETSMLHRTNLVRSTLLRITLGVLLVQSTSYPQSRPEVETDEGFDDPIARANYEWMRLRDPATGTLPASIRAKELAFAATQPTKESLARLTSYKGKRVSTVQALEWSPRGPVNVGGRTRALAVDVADTNIILGGGVSGGMWRSSDGGGSWTKATGVLDLQSVACIAQDTRAGHTNVWYYGTGETEGYSASGGGPPTNSLYTGDGIYKSTDNGISWAQLPSTVSASPQIWNQFDFIREIIVDTSNSVQDEVYAATIGGIQRSTDGGSTWSTVLGESGFDYSYSVYSDVAITSNGVVYAVLSEATVFTRAGIDSSSNARGIYRSTDGTTWTNILPAGWPAKYGRIVISIAPSDENVVYLFGETPGSGRHSVYNGVDDWTSFWKYTHLSGDGSGGGGNWENRSSNLPTSGPSGVFRNLGSYVLVVKAKPDDANVVFIGCVDLFRSTDGFATATNTSVIGGYVLNHHPDQHALVFSPNDPSVMFSGNDGGVHRTRNNLASTVVWESLILGYMTSQFYSLAIDHGTMGNAIVLGGTQDNGTQFTHSANPLVPWIPLDDHDGGYCAVADGRTSYYTSRQNGFVYRRILDSTGFQTGSTRVDPTGGSGYLFINPFLLDPSNSNVMYLAGGMSLWRNSNLVAIPLSSNNTTSVNWIQLSNTNIGSGTITSLGVSATPPNRLFYGTVDGRVFRLDSANVGNPVPTNVTASNFPAGAYVNCLAVDPSNANRCIAVFSNYSVVSLFYTTDAGTNWTDISGNLEQNPDGSGSGPSCRWASIVPEVGYFVGTSTGLYSTGALNGALTVWAQEGSTIVGNVVVDMMDARISDGVIVAATHGNGMYSATVGFVLQQYVIRKGWNMISIPVTSNYHTKSKLFPTAISNGFTYHGSYVQTDTFTNGPGYWLKFNNPQSVLVGGALRTHDTVNVAPGWNMIGSISSAVAVSGIASDPRGMVTSGFYGYDSMYTSRDTIHSGHAYWVKVDQSGQLILSASGPASNLLNIGIKGELPPEPPDDKTSDPTAGIPTHFGVDQNYPNPFNPITHFGYRITEVGLVSLRVFDVLGREVATLVNEVKQPGSYTVEFGAGNLASGIYFYRLQTGSGAQIRKMVLVR